MYTVVFAIILFSSPSVLLFWCSCLPWWCLPASQQKATSTLPTAQRQSASSTRMILHATTLSASEWLASWRVWPSFWWTFTSPSWATHRKGSTPSWQTWPSLVNWTVRESPLLFWASDGCQDKTNSKKSSIYMSQKYLLPAFIYICTLYVSLCIVHHLIACFHIIAES